MTFVIIVIVICLTVYGIMASKHNAEESKAFWGDHSDSSDVKKLKSRMKLLIDRVAVSYTHLTLPTILLV